MSDKKFLVVDDDSDDNGLFTEALAAVGPGIICYCVADGQEALEKLEAKLIAPPDIILMDINMPIMNGWQCLTRLKSAPDYKDIPVIIHSTSSRKTDKELAKDLGAICFFTKLHDFKRLKKMLEIVVEKMNANSVDAICNAVYKYLNLN
jgi:CheY-like chemotaxis protein